MLKIKLHTFRKGGTGLRKLRGSRVTLNEALESPKEGMISSCPDESFATKAIPNLMPMRGASGKNMNAIFRRAMA